MSTQVKEIMPKNRLWTKNFTIITIGTVVSLLGSTAGMVAIGLVVLDKTQSTFLFATFMVANSLPKIFLPMIAGPYMDNYSRTKVIYSLDFISACIYIGVFFLLYNGLFFYPLFLFLAVVIGGIDGVYKVAYESLYPQLITAGNYRKAYSISSTIYPFTAVMVLGVSFLYDNHIGLEWVFLFNACTYFVAACCETQIKTHEDQVKTGAARFSVKRFEKEFMDGLNYIRAEKGLQFITAFFFINMFAFAASATVVMPYFKSTPHLGMLSFTHVMAGGIIGQIVGGFLQYRFKYPTEKKFMIAVAVYIVISVVEVGYLFSSYAPLAMMFIFPITPMFLLCMLSGLLQVTTYNIRTAATQSYVPNEYRGRFNGTFQMICTLGTCLGQLIAGGLSDITGERLVLSIFMSLNLLAVLFIMLPGKKYVQPIYNRDV